MSAPRRLLLLLLACLSLPALAAAQTNLIVGTVKTTSTSTTSACIGCTTGGTTAAANSGMKVATISMEQLAAPSVTTNKLYSIAGALYFNGASIATGGTITGTANTVGLFTGPTAIGNSIITQNAGATLVTVTGALTVTGAVIGASFAGTHTGNGAGLTSIPASAVSTGSLVATVGSGTGITSSVTVGNNVNTVISLNNTAVSPNTYGSSVAIPQFTVDQQGRLTFATAITPQLTLTSTYFSSLSGANLTALPASQLSGTTMASNVVTSSLTSVGTLLGLAVSAATGQINVTSTTGTNSGFLSVANTGGSAFFGINNSTGTGITTGGTAYSVFVSAAGSTRDVQFATNDTVRMTIDSSGHVHLGANITDAVATPTISSGFGTSPSIAGKASFFKVTVGTCGTCTTGTVNFNATFSSAPPCIANLDVTLDHQLIVSSTTTQVVITPAGGFSFPAASVISVLCRGY